MTTGQHIYKDLDEALALFFRGSAHELYGEMDSETAALAAAEIYSAQDLNESTSARSFPSPSIAFMEQLSGKTV